MEQSLALPGSAKNRVFSWPQNEWTKYRVWGGKGGGEYISRSGVGEYISRSGVETWMNGYAPEAASLAGKGSKEVLNTRKAWTYSVSTKGKPGFTLFRYKKVKLDWNLAKILNTGLCTTKQIGLVLAYVYMLFIVFLITLHYYTTLNYTTLHNTTLH